MTTGPPTLDGPTYGSVAPPPFSPTQSHSNVVTKHKHVFALDPEGSYTPDQIAQGFVIKSTLTNPQDLDK